jgi:hypothetical protein
MHRFVHVMTHRQHTAAKLRCQANYQMRCDRGRGGCLEVSTMSDHAEMRAIPTSDGCTAVV